MRRILTAALLLVAIGCATVKDPVSHAAPSSRRQDTPCTSFESSEEAKSDMTHYAAEVQSIVQGNWHVPEAQMVLRQRGWVAIRFEVQADGRISDLKVVHPSGIPSYDRSAIDALRSSSPLPPLPRSAVTAPVAGTIRFFYNMASEGCG